MSHRRRLGQVGKVNVKTKQRALLSACSPVTGITGNGLISFARI
jgi:hypothetical protein